MALVLRKPPKLEPRKGSYPYQLDAVNSLSSLEYSAVFHEQGLGKTKIAIDLVLRWLEEDQIETVFIITKKSLVQNWVREIGIHSHVTPRVLSGNRRENSIALNSPVLIYVTNYEVISANLELIGEFLLICKVGVVLDESQKIKNPHARVSQSLHSLSEGFVRRVIMTGTPVANRPFDIWSQIRFLDGGDALGDSFEEFKSNYDLPNSNERGEGFARNVEQLLKSIRPFSIRETKQTAGLELPDKKILTHRVALSPQQARIYASYRDQLSYEIRESGNIEIDDAEVLLKRLLRLVQCASNPGLIEPQYKEPPGKLLQLVSLLKDVDFKQDKIIVWTSFVENVEWLARELAEYGTVKVHGHMSVDERNQSIDRFKVDPTCRLLLATPGAAKEGLTLTVANRAIFFDRSFSLDDYLQAQDRIHRISQSKECYVHNLIATNTIDEWVDALLNAKRQAAAFAQGDISDAEFETASTDDLSLLLEEVLTPNKD